MGKGKRAVNTKEYKRRKSSKPKLKKFILFVIIMIVLAIVAYIMNDYIILGKNKKINLVINNNNVTARLENDVIIEENTIYLSEPDISRFFDIYISQIGDKIVTTYDKKIAEIGFEEDKMEVNGSTVKTHAHAKKGDNNVIYLPISEMKDVYGVEMQYYENTLVVTMDSISKEQKKCTVESASAIKSSTGLIAKTLARVKKGSYVVKIDEAKKGWTKVRTDDGKIGYIKSKKLVNEITVRENMDEEKQVNGKVNMFWDYFSESAKAPDRSGQTINGVNVVSPAFFRIDGEGKFQENIGDEGKKYIEWAHNNGYKVWPMIQNTGSGENMLEVTSNILNDYEKRKELIENITNACVNYELDGINIDFENMKEEDKDQFSRFIIELTPRIKEIGDVISVDVTAPDGDSTWSLCFDRNVIAHVANYIIFMAYDQYGVASSKPGTTAGYNWVKNSLNKFLDKNLIDADPEKVILAIPFYTRLWTQKNGEEKATSKVVSMKDIDSTLPNGIEKKWDNDLKQNYVEYENKDSVMKMWIEDEESIKAKLSLVTENNLGGVAAWQKGMEPDNIWNVIKSEISK